MALKRPVIHMVKISLNVRALKGATDDICELYKSESERLRLLGKPPPKRESSFCVLRELDASGAVFTLFFTGHINITNISSCTEAARACQLICDKLGIHTVSYHVDTITACGKINLKNSITSLQHMCDIISRNKTYLNVKSLNFDRQKFPGAFIKSTEHSGTIILFSSAKFVIVGGKSEEGIAALHDWLEVTLWNAATMDLRPR